MLHRNSLRRSHGRRDGSAQGSPTLHHHPACNSGSYEVNKMIAQLFVLMFIGLFSESWWRRRELNPSMMFL